MCVISVFEAAKKPTLKTLREMFDANPDGAGIAYQTPDRKAVRIIKGLFTFDAVKKAIAAIPTDAGAVVFHSRIATSGGITAGKCHPYVIGAATLAETEATETECRAAFAHNGIIPLKLREGANDSETFVLDYINPIFSADADGVAAGKYNAIFSRLLGASGGRAVIMTGHSLFLLSSEWGGKWTSDGGATVSNTNYKPAPKYSADRWSGYGYGKYSASGYDYEDSDYEDVPLLREARERLTAGAKTKKETKKNEK